MRTDDIFVNMERLGIGPKPKRKRTAAQPTKQRDTDAAPYYRAALEAEMATMAATPEGRRNDQLNISAFNLGQLVPHGLSEQQVTDGLTTAAQSTAGTPMTDREIEGTIRSGLESGMAEPRYPPESAAHVEQTAESPQLTEGEQHSGQVRMAYRLARAAHDRLLHVHDVRWHHWDGKRWTPDDKGQAPCAVIEVLRTALAESISDKKLRADVSKCESDAGIRGVLGVASALPQFAATVRDLDADPYLLNVANGTLDLRTHQLRPHSPADRITKVTRAAYDPEAPSRLWAQFLDRVLPDELVRAYVQRLAGVALLGKVTDHVLPILTGTGANGKSTFINALLFALGDYASTAEPDLFMHREGAHPTGEMDLMGRRLVVVSESERDRRLAEATMKRLTGGDVIRARRMRQDFVEFTPSHTPLLITNHLPKVSGDDAAIWRRLRVVPFDVVIPPAERNPHLDEALAAEADAILAWAIQGWQSHQAGGLNEPQAVLLATDGYKRANDAVARFITDACVTTSPALKATTGQLFEAWERWRIEDGTEPISQKAFGSALDAKGYPVSSRTTAGRWRTGIGIKIEGTE
ncbi:DNA primase family protein [Mycobacteroides abscessus]|uniref:DNA primase family protein n=1 Tax=Mycobacteroides abscessus TaxID=36809 RepID=UPI001EEE3175|nr:phage/plasmid primase, P4 family [Mycobacteroides abscessus]